MPVHDWSSVRAGWFHHFHNSWIYKISDRLSGGLLPEGFYAAGEQVAGGVEPDSLVLEERGASLPTGRPPVQGALALAEHPPRVHSTLEAEEAMYLRKQDRVVIRSSDGDRVVALIEILSRGNKGSRHELERFLRKTASALDSKYHLLIVDLHPPGPFDPDGIHAAIWAYLFGNSPEMPADRPLTLVSYRAEPVPTAYVEPTAVAMRLPDMPLFLDPSWYVNVPLEDTYLQTWSGLPEPWKRQIAPGRSTG
jgi:hypothetical protein